MNKKFSLDNGQLIQELNGVFTPCLCPFRPPMQTIKQNPITRQNEIEIQHPGCNIQCHFFEVVKKSYEVEPPHLQNNEIEIVKTNCTGSKFII